MVAEMTKEQFQDELARLEALFSVQRPELELTVRDPGLGVEGFVVVWNSAPGKLGPLGPCGKGGTRITPSVSIDEVTMLAQRMEMKNAAAGLAMGGAKSGLKGDPDSPGFEKKYRRFVQLIKPILREHGGIFGGLGFDIGARPEHPIWACLELGSGSSFTGKPLQMGGTDYDREGIAGLGVAVAGRSAIEARGGSIVGARCAIQGLGAMGAAVFRYLTEFGADIAAVSDPRLGGSFVFRHRISEPLREAIIAQDFPKSRVLAEASGAVRSHDNADVLFEDVDIVFPCAVQDVLNEQNVERVKAPLLIEGANGPCLRAAQIRLAAMGKTVIPDFIANPGGIIAAYVEMTSEVTPEENVRTKAKVVEARRLTEQKIGENVKLLLELAGTLGIDPVEAGRYQALKVICAG